MATSKPIKPISIWGFKGMDNLPRSAANMLDQNRQATPHVLLDADVTDGGVVMQRGGFKALSRLNPWPFADIPLPPFLWRPDLTGDYRNVGSDGSALDLVVDPGNAGVPPGTFNNGWVINNPTGDAASIIMIPYNPDVSDLGNVWSMIFKINAKNGGGYLFGTSYNGDATVGWQMYWWYTALFGFVFTFNEADPEHFFNQNGNILLIEGIDHIVVVTCNNGAVNLYIDGVHDTPLQLEYPGVSPDFTGIGDSGSGVYIGDTGPEVDGPSGDGCTIRVHAIAKGIAYTPAQVAEITAGLSGPPPAIPALACHSLAGQEKGLSVMLCVGQGAASPQSLFQVEEAGAQELAPVLGPPAQLSYVEINNRVYMGNPYWTGVFNILTGKMESWGVPVPAAPQIALVEGALPPGEYKLCYVNRVAARISGNGPLAAIRWEGGTFGIQLNNLPAGGECWITQPNGKYLFKAPMIGNVVSGIAPKMQPLATMMVQPPPGFAHHVYGHGRIWGIRGKRLYYSDVGLYEWFRPKNYLPFPEDLTLIGPAMEGLFVSSWVSTWYLEGRDPKTMKLTLVGQGAIPGTLAMTEQDSGHYTISRPDSFPPTPTWMSPSGIVVGSHSGHVVEKTEHRLRINPRAQGASLYRLHKGIPQIITSLFGPPEGKDVADLDAIFERGRIYIPEPLHITETGGFILGGS